MSDAVDKDTRAKELGDWLFAWRQKRGLSRPEAVSEALKHDPRASISPDYLSKLEYGIRSLASASLDVREALRLALGIKREIWEQETGLLVPAVLEAPFDPRTLFHPPARQERIKRPLFPNLAAMIEEKSAKYPKLRRVGWQQHLNQTRFSGGQEPDADGWFEMFRALERAGVEPEEWPEE